MRVKFRSFEEVRDKLNQLREIRERMRKIIKLNSGSLEVIRIEDNSFIIEYLNPDGGHYEGHFEKYLFITLKDKLDKILEE